jgi:hypothetical protein
MTTLWPWPEVVDEEIAYLDRKISSLCELKESAQWETLSDLDRDLLREQQTAMEAYLTVLVARKIESECQESQPRGLGE